jgi:hypothetical protein
MQRHHHGHHHLDHDHDHHHGDGHEPHGGPGHNHAGPPRAVAQWQTPHQPQGAQETPAIEPDLDKVETAFVESFFASSDQTSFLRLARIPFQMTDAEGTRLHLLRVEIDALTDVGSLTPHLGGASFRYDPLPSGLVSQRRRLRFVYFDGKNLRSLGYADLRMAENPR